MKNLLLLLCLTTFSFSLSAQKSVKRFYNKYKHAENVTNVKVQGWMIKTVLTFVEDFEGQDIVKKVTKLRVLSMENGNVVSEKDLNKLIQGVKSENFEDLMTIREGSTNVRFLIRDNDRKIKDLLVIVCEENEFVLISIECNLKWKDLKNIDFDKVNGGEFFQKLPPKLPNVPRA
jgi:hypothetical protein